jgi:hypothetical protein
MISQNARGVGVYLSFSGFLHAIRLILAKADCPMSLFFMTFYTPFGPFWQEHTASQPANMSFLARLLARAGAAPIDG